MGADVFYHHHLFVWQICYKGWVIWDRVSSQEIGKSLPFYFFLKDVSDLLKYVVHGTYHIQPEPLPYKERGIGL